MGYNLTEVPAMMNQNTVLVVGHKDLKNQVHVLLGIYSPVSCQAGFPRIKFCNKMVTLPGMTNAVVIDLHAIVFPL